MPRLIAGDSPKGNSWGIRVFSLLNLLSKKHRSPPALIEIEDGPKKYMLLSVAQQRVAQGRALIVSGRVRFLDDITAVGYETSPDILRWAPRESGHGGPICMQAVKV